MFNFQSNRIEYEEIYSKFTKLLYDFHTEIYSGNIKHHYYSTSLMQFGNPTYS